MKFFLVIAAFLLIHATCFAQRIATTHLIKYTQKDGLPSYNVRKVFQDSKGFIWVGTQDGVSRFDGRTFINYAKSASPKYKICGVDVREIVEDSARHILWVLPGEVGINAISTLTGKVVQTAVIPQAGMEDWNLCMLKDKHLLWIGTSTGVKVYNTDKGIFEQGLPLPFVSKSATVFEARSIAKDAYGKLWVGYSGYGILVYDPDKRTIIKTIPLSGLNDHTNSHDIRFYANAHISRGEILYATSQGLRKINYSPSYEIAVDNYPCQDVPALNTVSTEYVTINKEGNILVSGMGKFYQFNKTLNDHTVLEEPAKVQETDWLDAVQYVYQDNENNTWLGCQEGLGFIAHQSSPFTPFCYDKKTNIKLEHVRSLYASDKGQFLVGLRNGIVAIDPVAGKYVEYAPGHLYHHIFEDRKGLIHAARDDGMFIYRDGVLTSIAKIYPEFAPFASVPLNSHLFLNDSLVVLGTESSDGLLLWNTYNKTVRKIEQHGNQSLLASSIVNNIYRDSKGYIWVLSDNVISILSPDLTQGKKITLREKSTGLDYKLFFDMCEVNGHYWIASYGSGVLQLDSSFRITRVVSTANGLSNNCVYQLFNINSNKLAVTSDNGLSVIDLADSSVKTYYSKHGLHSNSFEEVAGLMKNGKIYAGGLNGFTVIDPALFSANTTPPMLYINGIQVRTPNKVTDTNDIRLQSLEINNHAVQTVLYFSVLNFSNPDKASIAYKIDEQHTDWINLGNNNSLPLIGMGAGTYHLQLQAYNENGTPSAIQRITLHFLPKWYKTWWFKLLLLLAGIGIIFTVYRLRIAQLKKENQIRTKLASDLHDDLGSTMNSIKVYSNLALMDKQEKHLYKIKEGAQEAIISIRDIIWVLDDSMDIIENLFARIDQFASPLCEANDIFYQSEVSEEARKYKLGQEERRSLYMMLKEAVNNTVKYADARSIHIQCSLKKGKPFLLVKDNGKGFAMGKVHEGNGLKNMNRRAGQIHYAITISSAAGQGTSIALQKLRHR